MLPSGYPSISRSDRHYKQETRIKIAIPLRGADSFAGSSALKSYVLLLRMKWSSEFAVVFGAKVLQHCTDLSMIEMSFQAFLR